MIYERLKTCDAKVFIYGDRLAVDLDLADQQTAPRLPRGSPLPETHWGWWRCRRPRQTDGPGLRTTRSDQVPVGGWEPDESQPWKRQHAVRTRQTFGSWYLYFGNCLGKYRDTLSKNVPLPPEIFRKAKLTLRIHRNVLNGYCCEFIDFAACNSGVSAPLQSSFHWSKGGLCSKAHCCHIAAPGERDGVFKARVQGQSWHPLAALLLTSLPVKSP